MATTSSSASQEVVANNENNSQNAPKEPRMPLPLELPSNDLSAAAAATTTATGPMVWITQGKTDHAAYILEEREGRKLVKWAWNNKTQWLDASAQIKTELPKRRRAIKKETMTDDYVFPKNEKISKPKKATTIKSCEGDTPSSVVSTKTVKSSATAKGGGARRGSKTTRSRKYPVGTKVYKDFPPFGMFAGEVVAYFKGRLYKVVYEDKEHELLGEKEVDAIVVDAQELERLVRERDAFELDATNAETNPEDDTTNIVSAVAPPLEQQPAGENTSSSDVLALQRKRAAPVASSIISSRDQVSSSQQGIQSNLPNSTDITSKQSLPSNLVDGINTKLQPVQSVAKEKRASHLLTNSLLQQSDLAVPIDPQPDFFSSQQPIGSHVPIVSNPQMSPSQQIGRHAISPIITPKPQSNMPPKQSDQSNCSVGNKLQSATKKIPNPTPTVGAIHATAERRSPKPEPQIRPKEIVLPRRSSIVSSSTSAVNNSRPVSSASATGQDARKRSLFTSDTENIVVRTPTSNTRPNKMPRRPSQSMLQPKPTYLPRKPKPNVTKTTSFDDKQSATTAAQSQQQSSSSSSSSFKITEHGSTVAQLESSRNEKEASTLSQDKPKIQSPTAPSGAHSMAKLQLATKDADDSSLPVALASQDTTAATRPQKLTRTSDDLSTPKTPPKEALKTVSQAETVDLPAKLGTQAASQQANSEPPAPPAKEVASTSPCIDAKSVATPSQNTVKVASAAHPCNNPTENPHAKPAAALMDGTPIDDSSKHEILAKTAQNSASQIEESSEAAVSKSNSEIAAKRMDNSQVTVVTKTKESGASHPDRAIGKQIFVNQTEEASATTQPDATVEKTQKLEKLESTDSVQSEHDNGEGNSNNQTKHPEKSFESENETRDRADTMDTTTDYDEEEGENLSSAVATAVAAFSSSHRASKGKPRDSTATKDQQAEAVRVPKPAAGETGIENCQEQQSPPVTALQAVVQKTDKEKINEQTVEREESERKEPRILKNGILSASGSALAAGIDNNYDSSETAETKESKNCPENEPGILRAGNAATIEPSEAAELNSREVGEKMAASTPSNNTQEKAPNTTERENLATNKPALAETKELPWPLPIGDQNKLETIIQYENWKDQETRDSVAEHKVPSFFETFTSNENAKSSTTTDHSAEPASKALPESSTNLGGAATITSKSREEDRCEVVDRQNTKVKDNSGGSQKIATFPQNTFSTKQQINPATLKAKLNSDSRVQGSQAGINLKNGTESRAVQNATTNTCSAQGSGASTGGVNGPDASAENAEKQTESTKKSWSILGAISQPNARNSVESAKAPSGAAGETPVKLEDPAPDLVPKQLCNLDHTFGRKHQEPSEIQNSLLTEFERMQVSTVATALTLEMKNSAEECQGEMLETAAKALKKVLRESENSSISSDSSEPSLVSLAAANTSLDHPTLNDEGQAKTGAKASSCDLRIENTEDGKSNEPEREHKEMCATVDETCLGTVLKIADNLSTTKTLHAPGQPVEKNTSKVNNTAAGSSPTCDGKISKIVDGTEESSQPRHENLDLRRGKMKESALSSDKDTERATLMKETSAHPCTEKQGTNSPGKDGIAKFYSGQIMEMAGTNSNEFSKSTVGRVEENGQDLKEPVMCESQIKEPSEKSGDTTWLVLIDEPKKLSGGETKEAADETYPKKPVEVCNQLDDLKKSSASHETKAGSDLGTGKGTGEASDAVIRSGYEISLNKPPHKTEKLKPKPFRNGAVGQSVDDFAVTELRDNGSSTGEKLAAAVDSSKSNGAEQEEAHSANKSNEIHSTKMNDKVTPNLLIGATLTSKSINAVKKADEIAKETPRVSQSATTPAATDACTKENLLDSTKKSFIDEKSSKPMCPPKPLCGKNKDAPRLAEQVAVRTSESGESVAGLQQAVEKRTQDKELEEEQRGTQTGVDIKSVDVNEAATVSSPVPPTTEEQGQRKKRPLEQEEAERKDHGEPVVPFEKGSQSDRQCDEKKRSADNEAHPDSPARKSLRLELKNDSKNPTESAVASPKATSTNDSRKSSSEEANPNVRMDLKSQTSIDAAEDLLGVAAAMVSLSSSPAAGTPTEVKANSTEKSAHNFASCSRDPVCQPQTCLAIENGPVSTATCCPVCGVHIPALADSPVDWSRPLFMSINATVINAINEHTEQFHCEEPLWNVVEANIGVEMAKKTADMIMTPEKYCKLALRHAIACSYGLDESLRDMQMLRDVLVRRLGIARGFIQWSSDYFVYGLTLQNCSGTVVTSPELRRSALLVLAYLEEHIMEEAFGRRYFFTERLARTLPFSRWRNMVQLVFLDPRGTEHAWFRKDDISIAQFLETVDAEMQLYYY